MYLYSNSALISIIGLIANYNVYNKNDFKLVTLLNNEKDLKLKIS